MAAILKSLRRAANDFRPGTKPRIPSRVVPLITLAQQRRERRFMAAAVSLLLVCGAAAGAVWYFGNSNKGNLETVMKIAPMPPVQVAAPTVENKKLSVEVAKADDPADISLPAESLSPEADMADRAPARDADSAITIVAQKLGDLPVMGATHASMTDAAAALPDEDDVLSAAHHMLDSGDFAAAIILYDRVLAAHGNSAAALAGKAFAQQRGGQYDDAIATLHRLNRIEPDDAVVRTNLAAALGRSQSADAFIELEKMAEATPDFAPAQAAYAHMLAQQGNMPEALKHLDRAARLQPANLSYRLQLAILYDKAGHKAEAFTLYQQIIRAHADQDEPETLPLSLDAIRQRVDYLAVRLEASSASTQ